MLPALALLAALAFADPAAPLRVRYVEGVPSIELIGDYPQARYTVTRSSSPDGASLQIGGAGVLCLGTCFAQDPDAQPGATYWYRFQLVLADGELATFGPYAVTISPTLAARVAARIEPNPWRSTARLVLRAGTAEGPPIPARAVLVDLAGRRLRTFVAGSLARGTTSIAWDGRDDRGHALAAGTYFLRLDTALGSAVTRIVRLP